MFFGVSQLSFSVANYQVVFQFVYLLDMLHLHSLQLDLSSFFSYLWIHSLPDPQEINYFLLIDLNIA